MTDQHYNIEQVTHRGIAVQSTRFLYLSVELTRIFSSGFRLRVVADPERSLRTNLSWRVSPLIVS